MVEQFPGCDGGDPGTPQRPAIWLFGIEPGYTKIQDAENDGAQPAKDEDYSVEKQKQWRFNKNAFRLLAVVDGRDIKDWESFAHQRQIFSNKSDGYFKGNLYPRASNNVSSWTAKDQSDTNFLTKKAFRQNCRKNHWPIIRRWVSEHQPKLIICAGIGFAEGFASVLLQDCAGLQTHQLSTVRQKIKWTRAGSTTLVVIPHLSRPLSGCDAIAEAGRFIRELDRHAA